MKIQDSTKIQEIIGSHEKRIGTLELVLQGFLISILVKRSIKIILDKIHNFSENV